MFRRKKTEGDDVSAEHEPLPENSVAPAGKPGLRPMPATGSAPSLTAPSLPNRVPNLPPRPAATELGRSGDYGRPSELPRRASELGLSGPLAAPSRSEAETRQLIVGREISLSGEITACDRLVVEGSVEANLANCRDIDIAESGLFKGSASIDEAEIRGRFEGTLTVKKRLFIRATGRVTGTIRYGQIEVECGGQISGDIQAQSPADSAEPKRERGPQPVVEVGPSRIA